jgi:DNA-binding XRE family transcriptional regulator
MNLLREYIREIITERDNSAGPGFRYIYRGMKIDMPSAGLASQIRKLARNQSSALSEREAGSFIMAQLENEEIGESWTLDMDVASSFADVWSATNRGKTLHVMFWGKVPNDFGYDPQAAGEEPGMFSDESEVRIPKGEEIEIATINVFIADKKGGKNWSKFKPVAFSMGKVKA